MIHLNPLEDGKTHINVYSKGKTEFGRLLSNFAHTPFDCSAGHFESVEGYWYWILTGDDRLREMIGFQAKKFGRELPLIRNEVTEQDLEIAYRAKLNQTPGLKEMLLNNNLPLVHYYVQDGRVIYQKEFFWTASLWSKLMSKS